MADFTRNFIAGRMNKIVDQRLLPEGEYVDAMNIRMGSTENSEVGVITNTNGNSWLTKLAYTDGTPLSINAKCIGAIQDSARETIYWFVHDPTFTVGATDKLDLIMSHNVLTNITTYHVISIDDGGGINTTLNFNPSYLITGVNIIEDLLFFTDDYNAPRFINIKRNYPNPVSNIDALNPESILVIKKPPVEAPMVQPIATSGQENYLETRFICFAYRYRYIDGEYSATSQWSAPAFIPNQFSFTISSVLNEGMTNFCNAAIVNYNTGGPLVVGIDLLFKQSENNIIKIIQKIDKAEAGFGDYQTQQFTFNNSKIFTILTEAEILRLYDNVPRFAKAQTIMGNRLMYGNYVEGYNLIDKNGVPLRLEYSTNLISLPIGNSVLLDDTANGIYNIDPSEINNPINNSIVTFDLAGKDLVEGSSINLDITISHSSFSGTVTFPDTVTNNVDYSFSFLLTTSYDSVYELATSAEFENAVGTVANILPVSTNTPGVDTSCNGSTFTDAFNCELPQNLGTSPNVFFKYGSGIDAISEPIKIITSPASTVIGFQFPAMEYVDDIDAPTKKVYEYYQVIYAQAIFQEIANPRSLHSNRGYEIGIVYMDEFNRSTTALVSPFNAEYVPCGYSTNKNSIQVTIPSGLPATQRAPAWATRYKFVIKPDVQGYETVYSNIFFVDPETNEGWLLLEGENMQKVENGDRLIIKADSTGPTFNCVYTTVLEKTAQSSGFLEIPTESDPDVNVKIPAGLYIKVFPNNFDLTQEQNAIIAPGKIRNFASGGDHLQMAYPMNIEGTDPANPTWTYVDYSIPAGSKIQWYTDWNRQGTPSNCSPRGYNLEKLYTVNSDYDNMYEWFIGDNIKLTINSGTDKGDNETNVFIPGYNRKLSDDLLGTVTSLDTNKLINSTAQFITDGVVPGVLVSGPGSNRRVLNVISETELELSGVMFSAIGQAYRLIWTNGDINFWRFYRDPVTNELQIWFTSTFSCRGTNYRRSRRIYITADIQVFRSENVVIFETEPSDALPDVFFENELSFEIDADGNHMGNIQDQDIAGGIPAIVDTQFFNCFAFGNGVESYKIRDSIVGKPFNFGERVTTVAAQDYKAADRFSDITYSGIYNGESNINKLNEFNAGLSNFKNCEASFGEISLLDGRNTDVLTLQEDKISYVLAEKNLLSDASAGGIITATPEVLGTQIARTEKYGISFNPESYIQWGFDRYFTDVKRGAVIQLKGGDSQNEQLVVVSEANMRTWFRDTFNASFNTQKLGGFDPYMNEYVLSSNDRLLPVNPQCLACGVSQTFTLSLAPPDILKTFVYCVDLGPLVGLTEISWNFINIEAGKTLTVSVNYNGVVVTSVPTNLSGSIFFNKDNVSIETAEITLKYTGDMVVTILANCVQSEPMTIIEVVLTNNSDSGKTIHTQYRYENGDFVGPLLSNLVLFASGTSSPLVSRYNATSGFVGTGGFPPEFSDMRLLTNAIVPDNYVFNIAQDKFRFLRTSTLYENNSVDMNALVSASTIATPNAGAAPLYYVDFVVPASSNGEYLYLIWDFRDFVLVELCFALNVIDACCDCTNGDYYINTSSFNTATNVFVDSEGSYITAPNGFYSIDGIVRKLVDGVLLPQQPCNACSTEVSLCFGISAIDVCCACNITCESPSNTFLVSNPTLSSVLVGFYNSSGIYEEQSLGAESNVYICSVGYPTCSNVFVTIEFDSCGCLL